MELIGIEICNFRSMGKEPVVIYPMKKCNILIGKNNVGKSNIIRAIQWFTTYIRSGNPNQKPSGIDRYRRLADPPCTFKLTFWASSDEQIAQVSKTQEFFFLFSERPGVNGLHIVDNTFVHIESVRNLSQVLHLIDKNYRQVSVEILQKQFLGEEGNRIFNSLFLKYIPNIEFIPQFRQIQTGDSYEFNGRNLIKELHRYQHPSLEERHLKRKFDSIERLLRNLLHLPDAKLEVRFDGAEIFIDNNELPLPLDAHGTGVQELIILATAILSIENKDTICCIEEPEIHLHPSLQREFIEFITNETNIRYLISTHSSILINVQSGMSSASEDIQVFHLRLQDGATVGGPVLEDNHALDALNDIGVKASDLLQANCVIWVEGPSDRIYLNRWIELLDNSLVEGLHYSIMFYGGRLLSHIGMNRSNDDKVPDELIDLLKVNQHAAVIIDSDKDEKRKRINNTKQRIRTECDKSESFCWITDGREIENYLPERVVQAVFERDTGKQIDFVQYQYDKFEDTLVGALKKARAKEIAYETKKVKYARKFAECFTVDDIDGDLKSNLTELIAKIKEWNR
jgi:putative ATP-dependent endonuclease of the OLD family